METGPPWLVMDVSRQGEFRITHVTPAPELSVAPVRTYDAASLLTFTDGLLAYQRDTGLALRDVPSVLAIAGAAVGESLQVMRSRWTISRSGLQALLGRAPLIVNDSAAKAWAVLGAPPQVKAVRGHGRPDPTRAGRFAFVALADGLGGALLDIDDRGVARVTDSEAGHADFAPRDEQEAMLARACTPHRGLASWEQVLVAEADTVAAACKIDRTAAGRMKAALLGRFTVNLCLTFGAWNGALLTGWRIGQVLAPGTADAFDAAFADRRAFRRLVADMGCWQLDQHEPVVAGCVAMIAQRTAAAA
jgi:glucokinase